MFTDPIMFGSNNVLIFCDKSAKRSLIKLLADFVTKHLESRLVTDHLSSSSIIKLLGGEDDDPIMGMVRRLLSEMV